MRECVLKVSEEIIKIQGYIDGGAQVGSEYHVEDIFQSVLNEMGLKRDPEITDEEVLEEIYFKVIDVLNETYNSINNGDSEELDTIYYKEDIKFDSWEDALNYFG